MTRKLALETIAVLKAGSAKLKALKDEPQFILAAIEVRDQFDQQNDIEHLQLMIEKLADVADALDLVDTPKKFNSTYSRNQRIKLAVLLTPLFEQQFKAIAKPVGGDRPVSDEDANDWTRFYQMAASLIWHEQATPDRQRVLREAIWPPA